MKTDKENNEWKAEAPYLAGLQNKNPFRVPEQYFDELPQSIANSVYLSQLSLDTEKSGFTVPDQFFDSLHKKILLETSEDVTRKFPSAAGYNIPDLYFDKLQSSILTKTINAGEIVQPAQTVTAISPLKPAARIVRLWHSGILKYATAACFVLLSTFGIYLNQHNFSSESTATDLANEQMLYDISEQDVIDHIEGSSPDIQKTSIADTDMENYILNNYSQNDLSSAL